MKLLVAACCVLGLIAMTCVPGNAAQQFAHATLMVTPQESHAGGTIYLSGAGFPANRASIFTLSCPGRIVSTRSVRIGGRGVFEAVPLRIPFFLAKRRTTCQVATQRPKTVGRLAVLPPAKSLDRCSASICVRLHGTIVRLRSTTIGQIAVSGWPGATATITITRPRARAIVRSLRLGWNGTAGLRMNVSLGLRKASQDRILVVVRFGAVTGTATGRFVVVPGGR